MSSIVRSTIKGTTYCYRSESYWDKEKKAPRSKRVLIGKIDPETGLMIPTKPRGGKKSKDEGYLQDAAVQEEAATAEIPTSDEDSYRKQCLELKEKLLYSEQQLVQMRNERDKAVRDLEKLKESIRRLVL